MISTTNSRRCNSIPDAESLYTRICIVCKLFLQIMQNIFKRGRTVRIRRRMFIECSFAPEQLRVFLQCGKQQQPESAAAHNFADENGECEQRNRLRHFRYFCDNKRHDDRVCCNRRQRSKPCTKGHAARQSTGGVFPEFPKSKSSDCADKRCKAAENKIIRQCACYQIGQQAADKQPGNRGRGKIRQNCQCFGYTKLKYAAHGRNKARCKRQYRVQRSNCGSRRKLPGRYFFLLSFVFSAYASVRMVSNSQCNYTTERICLQGQQPTYSIQ